MVKYTKIINLFRRFTFSKTYKLCFNWFYRLKYALKTA